MLRVMVFLWNNDGLAQNLLVRPSRLSCVTAIGLLAQDPFMECMSYVRFANYLFSVLSVQNSVTSRVSYGGTSPSNVRAQIKRWREALA